MRLLTAMVSGGTPGGFPALAKISTTWRQSSGCLSNVWSSEIAYEVDDGLPVVPQ